MAVTTVIADDLDRTRHIAETPRTSRAPLPVADSLGRGLVALRTSDLTAAAGRALRVGLRIPPGVTGAT